MARVAQFVLMSLIAGSAGVAAYVSLIDDGAEHGAALAVASVGGQASSGTQTAPSEPRLIRVGPQTASTPLISDPNGLSFVPLVTAAGAEQSRGARLAELARQRAEAQAAAARRFEERYFSAAAKRDAAKRRLAQAQQPARTHLRGAPPLPARRDVNAFRLAASAPAPASSLGSRRVAALSRATDAQPVIAAGSDTRSAGAISQPAGPFRPSLPPSARPARDAFRFAQASTVTSQPANTRRAAVAARKPGQSASSAKNVRQAAAPDRRPTQARQAA
ncbi:MAG: hypothetical protein AAGF32_10810, partial [Pseudomonadota bacterium]